MSKRTKIVCTLGPACESVSLITQMVKAGMNVARLNFSHGTYENHALLMKNIRAVERATGEPVAILQDLQGPKIRVGVLPEKGIELKIGDKISFDTCLPTRQADLKEYKAGGSIPVDYPVLHEYLVAGERILLNDGRSEVKVLKVEGTRIDTVVVVGGLITSHKGINVPDSNLQVSSLTDKDKADAKFGVKAGVDMMALSFVTSAKDIVDLRFLIKQYEDELGLKPGPSVKIIAKIERAAALKNIKEILAVVDGIMIARGDLGIETPASDLPLVQKKLIDAALDAAKPVIVATQMLDSMRENPRPTRAEVSDVANAVIDHADALMLSNETATGQYPVVTVETMAQIIAETEKSVYDDLSIRVTPHKKHKIDDIISELSRLLAEEVGAKLILAASISGETGRLISRHRPELQIVVGTATPRVQHQLNLSWGVIPFILEPCNSIEELVERAMIYLKKKKIVRLGDRLIVVAGEPVGHAGHVNLLEVREVS